MTREEIVALCESSNIDYVEVGSDFEHGAGMVFCWKGAPKDSDHEEVHVKVDVLATMTAPQLRRVVVNGRDVIHMTRIVGYFSRVQNWNKSKLGELKDRHKGNYRVGRVETLP